MIARELSVGDWFKDPYRGDWREVTSTQSGPLLDSNRPDLGVETTGLIGFRTDRGGTYLWPDTAVEANPT